MIRERYEAVVNLHKMLEEAGIQHDFEEICSGAMVVYPSMEQWTLTMRHYHLMTKMPMNQEITDYHDEAYKKLSKDSCSAAQHDFTGGRNSDMIELMGMLTDEESKNDDVVVLDCEEVFKRIKEKEDKRRGIDPWRVNA